MLFRSRFFFGKKIPWLILPSLIPITGLKRLNMLERSWCSMRWFLVYDAEKEATRTLIDFYSAASAGSFIEVLNALKAFAKADADRFRLRDIMRAAVLLGRFRYYSSCYIEAGTMHFWLCRSLRRGIGKEHQIKEN